MRIRMFRSGEPTDVDIDAAGDGLTANVGGRNLAVTSIAESEGGGAIEIDGRAYRYLARRDGSRIRVAIGGESYEFDLSDSGGTARGGHGTKNPETRSPMPGKVLQVSASVGDVVKPGDALLVLEAMKMENVLSAEIAGTVAEVHVAPGDMVEPGRLLIVIRPEE